MPPLPRAILFDLDDTLLRAYSRPDLVWSKVTAEHAALLGPFEPAAVAAAIYAHANQFWAADPERQSYWRQRLYESRREIVRGAFGQLASASQPLDDSLAVRIADRFSSLRDEEMSLFPDTWPTLDALRARGVTLGVVTNGAGAPQRAKLERFDLARRFDHVQIEGEQGFGKPEERAYRHALESLRVTADEAWMVGDNLEWEVAAPQRLGIHAIWYDGEGAGLPANATARPDRIIRALAELVPESD